MVSTATWKVHFRGCISEVWFTWPILKQYTWSTLTFSVHTPEGTEITFGDFYKSDDRTGVAFQLKSYNLVQK